MVMPARVPVPAAQADWTVDMLDALPDDGEPLVIDPPALFDDALG